MKEILRKYEGNIKEIWRNMMNMKKKMKKYEEICRNYEGSMMKYEEL